LNGLSRKPDGNCLRVGKRNDGWRYGHEVVHSLNWQSVEINAGYWHRQPAQFGEQQIGADLKDKPAREMRSVIIRSQLFTTQIRSKDEISHVAF
jgi:hypothetical protein